MLRSYYIFLEKLSKQRVIYGLSFLIIITWTAAEAATSVEPISPILYTKSAHFLRYTLYFEWLARYDMALETRSLLWSQITEQTKRGILDIGTYIWLFNCRWSTTTTKARWRNNKLLFSYNTNNKFQLESKDNNSNCHSSGHLSNLKRDNCSRFRRRIKKFNLMMTQF